MAAPDPALYDQHTAGPQGPEADPSAWHRPPFEVIMNATTRLRTSTRAPTGASERRPDRTTFVVLAVALALIAAATLVRVYRFTLPTEGWSFQLDFARGLVADRNLVGVPSPLEPGDVVLRIGDESLETLAPFVRPDPATRAAFRAGGTVPYTVQRDATTLTFDVPLVRWTRAGAVAAYREILHDRVGELPPWTVLELAVAAFVFALRPANRAAQLLFLFFLAWLVAGSCWVVAVLPPGDYLDPVARVADYFLGLEIHTLLIGPLLVHLALVFPGPRWGFGTRRWHPWALYGVPFVVYLLRDAYLIPDVADILLPVMALTVIAAAVTSLVRERDPERRAQMRWVGYGVVLYAVPALAFVLSNILGWLPPSVGHASAWVPAQLLLALCVAVAILRYQLFDIDVVINRTLVYAGLTTAVVAVYALVVGGIGGLASARARPVVSVFAAALVAVGFSPARDALQRAVNRLLYGQRHEPYRVLADLSDRLGAAGTPDAILPGIAGGVARALRLPYVAVALDGQDGAEVVAEAGRPGREALVLPLVHRAQRVGELRVEPRPRQAHFSGAEVELLRTVAQQTGAAAHAVRLTRELQHSRELLVTAREEERRRLRRDLHDGLGPTLAGIAMKLDAAINQLRKDPDVAESTLHRLKGQAQATVGDVRRLVYALRPPALDELGLVGALKSMLEGHETGGVTLALDAPAELPALPAAVEVAAYRIVQEALANVLRHANARACRVTLRVAGELEIEIADDGRGIEEGPGGIGLRSMRERAEELGGTLDVAPGERGGARVSARLPLPEGNASSGGAPSRDVPSREAPSNGAGSGNVVSGEASSATGPRDGEQ